MLRGAHTLVGERVTVQIRAPHLPSRCQWVEATISGYDDSFDDATIVSKPFSLQAANDDSGCPSHVNLPSVRVLFYQELQAQLQCQKYRSESGFQETLVSTLHSLQLRPPSHYTEYLLELLQDCANEPFIGARFSMFVENRWRDGTIREFDASRLHDPFIADLDNIDDPADQPQEITLNLPKDSVVFMYEVSEIIRFQSREPNSSLAQTDGNGGAASDTLLAELVKSLTNLCVREGYPDKMLRTISKCANEGLDGLEVYILAEAPTSDNDSSVINSPSEMSQRVIQYLSQDSGLQSSSASAAGADGAHLRKAFVQNGVVRGRIAAVVPKTSTTDPMTALSLRRCFHLHLLPWLDSDDVSGRGRSGQTPRNSQVSTRLPGGPVALPTLDMVFGTELNHFMGFMQACSEKLASQEEGTDMATITSSEETALLSALQKDYTRHGEAYATLVASVLPQFVRRRFVGKYVFVEYPQKIRNRTSGEHKPHHESTSMGPKYRLGVVVDVSTDLAHPFQIRVFRNGSHGDDERSGRTGWVGTETAPGRSSRRTSSRHMHARSIVSRAFTDDLLFEEEVREISKGGCQTRRKSGDRNWKTETEVLLSLQIRRTYSEAVLQRLHDCASAQHDALIGQNVWVCCRPYQEGLLAEPHVFALAWPALHVEPAQSNTDDTGDPRVWVRGHIVSVSYHARRAKLRIFQPGGIQLKKAEIKVDLDVPRSSGWHLAPRNWCVFESELTEIDKHLKSAGRGIFAGSAPDQAQVLNSYVWIFHRRLFAGLQGNVGNGSPETSGLDTAFEALRFIHDVQAMLKGMPPNVVGVANDVLLHNHGDTSGGTAVVDLLGPDSDDNVTIHAHYRRRVDDSSKDALDFFPPTEVAFVLLTRFLKDLTPDVHFPVLRQCNCDEVENVIFDATVANFLHRGRDVWVNATCSASKSSETCDSSSAQWQPGSVTSWNEDPNRPEFTIATAGHTISTTLPSRDVIFRQEILSMYRYTMAGFETPSSSEPQMPFKCSPIAERLLAFRFRPSYDAALLRLISQQMRIMLCQERLLRVERLPNDSFHIRTAQIVDEIEPIDAAGNSDQEVASPFPTKHATRGLRLKWAVGSDSREGSSASVTLDMDHIVNDTTQANGVVFESEVLAITRMASETGADSRFTASEIASVLLATSFRSERSCRDAATVQAVMDAYWAVHSGRKFVAQLPPRALNCPASWVHCTLCKTALTQEDISGSDDFPSLHLLSESGVLTGNPVSVLSWEELQCVSGVLQVQSAKKCTDLKVVEDELLKQFSALSRSSIALRTSFDIVNISIAERVEQAGRFLEHQIDRCEFVVVDRSPRDAIGKWTFGTVLGRCEVPSQALRAGVAIAANQRSESSSYKSSLKDLLRPYAIQCQDGSPSLVVVLPSVHVIFDFELQAIQGGQRTVAEALAPIRTGLPAAAVAKVVEEWPLPFWVGGGAVVADAASSNQDHERRVDFSARVFSRQKAQQEAEKFVTRAEVDACLSLFAFSATKISGMSKSASDGVWQARVDEFRCRLQRLRLRPPSILHSRQFELAVAEVSRRHYVGRKLSVFSKQNWLEAVVVATDSIGAQTDDLDVSLRRIADLRMRFDSSSAMVQLPDKGVFFYDELDVLMRLQERISSADLLNVQKAKATSKESEIPEGVFKYFLAELYGLGLRRPQDYTLSLLQELYQCGFEGYNELEVFLGDARSSRSNQNCVAFFSPLCWHSATVNSRPRSERPCTLEWLQEHARCFDHFTPTMDGPSQLEYRDADNFTQLPVSFLDQLNRNEATALQRFAKACTSISTLKKNRGGGSSKNGSRKRPEPARSTLAIAKLHQRIIRQSTSALSDQVLPKTMLLPKENTVFHFEVRKFFEYAQKTAKEDLSWDALTNRLADLALRSREQYSPRFLLKVAAIAWSRWWMAARTCDSVGAIEPVPSTTGHGSEICNEMQGVVLSPRRAFFQVSSSVGTGQWLYGSVVCGGFDVESKSGSGGARSLQRVWQFHFVPDSSFYEWDADFCKQSAHRQPLPKFSISSGVGLDSSNASRKILEKIPLEHFPTPRVILLEEAVGFETLQASSEATVEDVTDALQPLIVRSNYSDAELDSLKAIASSKSPIDILARAREYQRGIIDGSIDDHHNQSTEHDISEEVAPINEDVAPAKRTRHSLSATTNAASQALPATVDGESHKAVASGATGSSECLDADVTGEVTGPRRFADRQVSVLVPDIDDPTQFSWQEGTITSAGAPRGACSNGPFAPAACTIEFSSFSPVWCRGADLSYVAAAIKSAQAGGKDDQIEQDNEHGGQPTSRRRTKRKPRAPGDMVTSLEWTLPDPRVVVYEELRCFLGALELSAQTKSRVGLEAAKGVLSKALQNEAGVRPAVEYDIAALDRIGACVAYGLLNLEVLFRPEASKGWILGKVTKVTPIHLATYMPTARIVCICTLNSNNQNTDTVDFRASLDDEAVVYSVEAEALEEYRKSSASNRKLKLQDLCHDDGLRIALSKLALRAAYDDQAIRRIDGAARALHGATRDIDDGSGAAAKRKISSVSSNASPQGARRVSKAKQTPDAKRLRGKAKIVPSASPVGENAHEVVDLTDAAAWNTDLGVSESECGHDQSSTADGARHRKSSSLPSEPIALPAPLSSSTSGQDTTTESVARIAESTAPHASGHDYQGGLAIHDLDDDDLDFDSSVDGDDVNPGDARAARTSPELALDASDSETEDSDSVDADESPGLPHDMCRWWARAKNYLIQRLTFGALPADIDDVPLAAVEGQRCQLELLVSGVLLPRQVQPGATRNQNALVLLLGPPSTGKSLVVETVLHGFRSGRRPLIARGGMESGSEHTGCKFKTVYLDGVLLRSDEEAIGEICEQLSSGPQDLSKPGQTASTRGSTLAHGRGEHQLRFLVETIKNEAARGFAIVIVMKHFERFTARRKQTLLYNLFDLTQNPSVRVAIIGLSTFANATDELEKRIQSRFSHREVLFTRPPFEILTNNSNAEEAQSCALEVFGSILRLGPSVRNQSFSFRPVVKAFLEDRACRRVLRRQYELGHGIVWFQKVFALMLSDLRAADIFDIVSLSRTDSVSLKYPALGSSSASKGKCTSPLSVESLNHAISLLTVDPLRMMVQDMSTPELLMLIAARHCTQAKQRSGDAMNGGATLFGHALREYKRFLQQEEATGSFSASMDRFPEPVLYRSYGRLLEMGILRPLTGTGLGDARGQGATSHTKQGKTSFTGTFGLTMDLHTLPVGLGHLAFSLDEVLRDVPGISQNIRKWSQSR